MLNFFKKDLKGRSENEDVKTLVTTIFKKASYVYSANDLGGIEAYEALKKMPVEEQKELILGLVDFVQELAEQRKRQGEKHVYRSNDFTYYGKRVALAIQGGLIRKKLHYSEQEWIALFQRFRECIDQLASANNHYLTLSDFPINYAIKQLEYYLKGNAASETLTSFLKEVQTWEELSGTVSKPYYFGSDLTKAVKKLKEILKEEGELEPFLLKTNDIGEGVNQVIDSISDKKELYDQIFSLAFDVSGAKPSKKLSQSFRQLQDQIGHEDFRKIAHQILQVPLGHAPYSETRTYTYENSSYEYTDSYFLCQPSQQFIKGMVWTLDRFSDKETIQVLSRLCEKAYKKIPGKGPAAASIGNACVYVLGNMRGKDGLGALSRLKLKVRQNNVKKTIDKYLQEGAKRYNVSVEELKEMAVPDFQLEQGSKVLTFGEYQLKVYIVGRKVSTQWIKPDGNVMKSVPSTVKKSASLTNKLKEIRKELKEIQKVYAAQKQRIDNQFILDRTWDMASFQKYYLHHGLVCPITSKLIWTFQKEGRSAEAILLDSQWHTVNHEIIDWIDEETEVKLWHPVNADEQTIIGWREKMLELEWKQPIKQAFREIYLLTDAELNTRTYSNRMAAHILKQHQFNSLAGLRGWKYSLMGAYDDGRDNETCQKYLPEYQITAEYWIDELAQEDQFNDAGIWLYIATDQVKFKDQNDQVIELVNVPKMVFTEVMRDVDMFVGVCSVGNDPQWMDNNGARQDNRDYWHSYSFGDLTEIAKTRKSILERLLPRLKKIRDKAHIEGKFLIVEGNLRTYKIHIGSGNILMEPNDQYLCIVPARSAESTTDRLFIPFEGDKGLSIVLSKAFLLAEDDKITDGTITSQINRKR